MALPKLKKAGIEQASPQEVSKTPVNVKAEMERLANSIQQASADGLKASAQAVVGNVPAMIKEITDELKSGPVDNFAIAINKLVKLTNELGIDLRQYNSELADTVDRFNDRQMKLEDKLANFREQGLKAEIRGNQVVLLTQREIFALQQEYKLNEKEITSKTLDRVKLQTALDEADRQGADKRVIAQKDIEENEKEIAKLKEKNEKIEKKTGISADTGRDQGFSKFQELKEGLMIIPDTITEAMETFASAGKGVFKGIGKILQPGGLKKAFKGLINFFKTARIMIAGVFLLVVAAIQFVAERIDKIAAFFVKIWNKITDFFKAIGEWFSNSWLGKKLGLGKDDDGETDTRMEKEKAKSYDQLDDGTYAVGNDGAEIYDENKVNEFLAPSKDASNAPVVDFDGEIYRPGDEGYENAKANRTQDTQSYLDDEQGENAKSLSIKDIIGDNAGGQMKTSSMLKSLESESNNIKPPTVINVQNNATSNSAQSSATNVSGFLDHEPETTLKYVKQGSTGSADF